MFEWNTAHWNFLQPHVMPNTIAKRGKVCDRNTIFLNWVHTLVFVFFFVFLSERSCVAIAFFCISKIFFNFQSFFTIFQIFLITFYANIYKVCTFFVLFKIFMLRMFSMLLNVELIFHADERIKRKEINLN